MITLFASGYYKADSICTKDPNEKLEQLRRSSVLELEHLKQPDHPHPPLRALPEHSVPPDTAVHHHLAGKPSHEYVGASDKSAEPVAVKDYASTPSNSIPRPPDSGVGVSFMDMVFGSDVKSDAKTEEVSPSKEDVPSPTETPAVPGAF
jgi:glycogenin glucosyltransferase